MLTHWQINTKDMYDYDNSFFGMHFYWWVLWIIVLVWIFFIPYDIPGQRKKTLSPLDVLKNRLASGEITDEQFQTKKKLIDSK
jgi:putative membrane protein